MTISTTLLLIPVMLENLVTMSPVKENPMTTLTTMISLEQKIDEFEEDLEMMILILLMINSDQLIEILLHQNAMMTTMTTMVPKEFLMIMTMTIMTIIPILEDAVIDLI